VNSEMIHAYVNPGKTPNPASTGAHRGRKGREPNPRERTHRLKATSKPTVRKGKTRAPFRQVREPRRGVLEKKLCVMGGGGERPQSEESRFDAHVRLLREIRRDSGGSDAKRKR